MFFEPNEFLIRLIIGGRNSGKTTFVKGNPSVQVEGVMKEYWDTKNQRIIICDTNPAHPSYIDVPAVTIEAFKAGWGITRGVIKICSSDFTPLIEYCVTKPIRNTLFIFEDARKYVPSKWENTPWNKFTLDSKQNHIDIIFMYHVWGWVPPDLARVCDQVELFKTADSPDERKKYIGGMYTLARAAHARVQKHKNPFYHETIENRS